MAFDIRLPRLGWSMEEGTFQGWLKKDGEQVAVGEALFSLEGEKAVQDIEAVDAGTLYIPPDAPQPGATLPVGALLGYVLAPGEAKPSGSAPPTASSTANAESAERTSERSGGITAPPAAPSVRRLARELNVPLTSVKGSGGDGRITAADIRARSQSPTPALVAASKSSPRARRVAGELGIDWRSLQGTGAGGRVREADVRQAAAHGPVAGAGANRSQQAAARNGESVGGSIVTLSARRKVIADRMRMSRDRTVPVTLTLVADATNIVSLRNQFKQAATAPTPAYTDILACLVARVLRLHRMLAARWNDDQSSLLLPADDGLHVGIAVESSEGLLVPVLRDVANSSFGEVVARSRELIERARAGKLSAAEMQGGVFTISSLGGYGIDSFTPVINFPETAILGVGVIRREAVVLDDERIVASHRITLSLTFDHRAIDGAPAASFLRDVRLAVENPTPHLLG